MAYDHAPGHSPEAGVGLAEVLFEHRRLGAWLRVAAVDPASGLEAVATGPAEAPAMVERLALAKLRRLVAER